MNKIVLASASPRRKELLSLIGLSFDVITGDAEEITGSTVPAEMVEELSLLKARDVFNKLPKEERAGRIVIGADTVVSCDGKVLGKPKDKQHAFEMLSLLQGRSHEVYTGVTLLKGKATDDAGGSISGDRKKESLQINEREAYECITFHETTAVQVYPMSREEIWKYIDSDEPMDKAGSYGIQGKFAAHIKGIEGDYFNVVGLPIGRVYQELKIFL